MATAVQRNASLPSALAAVEKLPSENELQLVHTTHADASTKSDVIHAMSIQGMSWQFLLRPPPSCSAEGTIPTSVCCSSMHSSSACPNHIMTITSSQLTVSKLAYGAKPVEIKV